MAVLQKIHVGVKHMKIITLPYQKSRHQNKSPFFSLILAMLLLTFTWQVSYAQQSLSLADILIGLRSKKVTLEERNKLLTDAVKVRGITFALTTEIEKELQTTGATVELIDAIRQKTVPVKPIVKPSPTLPTATPTPLPEFVLYQKQADSHMVKGEYDMAIANYNKVIQLNPKNSESYLSRGLSYFNKKSYEQAVSDFSKSIELDPKEPIAYFNRAGSYEKLGNMQNAIADYQKTVELDGSNETAKASLRRLQDEQTKAELAKNEQLKIEQAKFNTTKTISQPQQSQQTKPDTESTDDQTQVISLGQITPELAVKMVTPAYSPEARRMNLSGQVTVQVSIDEEGEVTSAKAVSGVGLLRASSEEAARRSKFKPTIKNGSPVKANGYIVYNFKAN